MSRIDTFEIAGATITCNDPDMLPGFVNFTRKWVDEMDAFHQKMMKIGVKAYRCNDGWVDRKKHKVTFFAHDTTKGYYWGSLDLKKGDLIFIGNAISGGRLAEITDASWGESFRTRAYSFKPLIYIIPGRDGVRDLLPMKKEGQ